MAGGARQLPRFFRDDHRDGEKLPSGRCVLKNTERAVHSGPEPWVTRLLLLPWGGGAGPGLLGISASLWGMERQPGEGHVGLHTREGAHSKTLLSRTQPSSTVPGPATWVCPLYPHPYLCHPCWSQVEAERGNPAPEPTSLPLSLPSTGNASGLPCHHPATPAFPQVSRCPAVNGRTGLCRVQGTHSPVGPEGHQPAGEPTLECSRAQNTP